jgi:hypothetical protein
VASWCWIVISSFLVQKDIIIMPFFLYIQVKSDALFDNIIITDDLALAKTFAEETWGKHKEVCFSS